MRPEGRSRRPRRSWFWHWWRIRRRWWRAKRALTTVALLAMVVWAVASHSGDVVWRHLGPLVDGVRPYAEHALGWLDRQIPILGDGGDGSGAIEIESRAVEEPGVVRPVSNVPASRTFSGPALAVDGDTLDVSGVRVREVPRSDGPGVQTRNLRRIRVRLHGIDAPESKQTCRAGGRRWRCGSEATRRLDSQLAHGSVVCDPRDRDNHGRVVAVCRVGGRDLGAWMVAQGWALVNRRFSREYVVEEERARAAKRGVWRGEVVPPWEWRRDNRLRPAPTRRPRRPQTHRPKRPQTGRCNIKGNISDSGRRIYHVPGGKYYDQTRINRSRGERWFCSEAEARRAGWRRSRR